ncbi:MAG TPA: hypothetical protein VKB50_02540 [Vicinamibacterales bacterium]|nr:hypothetical protein [Vicinamibacterales bacterium]
MRMTRERAVRCVLGLAALLTVIRCASVPVWYADSQYYLQAGRLFRQGTVTFAGNLVGDRHLSIAYYQVFQSLFGPSADSVAIALSVAFGATACLVTGLCFEVGAGIWRPTLVAAGLILILALNPIWNSMLTDPLLLLILLVALAVLTWLPRTTSPIWSIAAIGVICGFGYGVRPETIIMFIAVVLTRLLVGGLSVPRWIGESAIAVIAMTAGYAAQNVAWSLWVPAPKPDTYSAAFAFYLPMYYNAEPQDGPAVAALDRIEASAGMPLTTQYIGLFPVMAAGVRSNAVKDTDRLIARAGFELLAAKPGRVLAMLLREGTTYLTRPKLGLEFDTDSWDARWQTMRERLRALDKRREAVSADFVNDAWWATESVSDRHVPMVARLRTWLPSWSAALSIPGLVLIIGILSAIVAVVRRQACSAPIVATGLFVVGAFVVTDFSQGFAARYSEIWRFLSLVILGLTSLTWRSGALTNHPGFGIIDAPHVKTWDA